MDDRERVSMDEIEGEEAVSLPNKEVLSLLDVNANVDLGLDLAAPVDLAAAANLNVAAPIEAAATANVLSPGAEAVGMAEQHGTVEQGIEGSATATAPQHAEVAQNAGQTSSGSADTAGTTPGAAESGTPNEPVSTDPLHDGTPNQPATPAGTSGATGTPADAASGATGTPADAASGATDAAAGATGAAGGAVDGVAGSAGSAADGLAGSAGNAADGAASTTTGGVDSLLNGGSLLDADVNIHADADLAAPVDGAVAANGNVAAPIDAAVGANVGSPDSVSEALAPQEVDISQNLDHVSADATADQDADVSQH
jgi:hypothetical protein